MKPKTILPVFLFFLSVFSYAQKISENHFASRYNYIFKLDSTQARMAYRRIQPDSSFYLRHRVDSFHTDSSYNYGKLEPGLYFIVGVRGSVVTYTSYLKQAFRRELWGLNKRTFVTLKDMDNHIIHDAKVTLENGDICRFVTGMGAYEIPLLKKEALVKMEYKGYWDYQFINPQYVAAPKINKSYPDYSYTTIAPGYLVFNQPGFKYYDTLKFKAFLLNDNGTAMKQKLRVYLGVDGKEKFIGSYKPLTPGAYSGQLEISDTMAIDRQYSLSFRNAANEVVKSNTFYLENYELKRSKHSLKGPKQKCLIGDRVSVSIGVLDANNLPVMDATITLDLKIRQINHYLTDRLFIPDKWFQESYLHIETVADPSGYTVIEFPDSLFRHFDAQYEIEVKIRDQDNNGTDLRANFEYENNPDAYEMHYEGDSLQINSYYKSESSKKELILESSYQNRSERKKIVTPYREAIDFYAHTHRLYLGDSLIMNYNGPYNVVSWVYFKGRRSADSIHIDLVNPVRLPVYYEVYKDKNKVSEGFGMSMSYHEADETAHSYHVIWGYNLPGEFRNNLKVQSFHLYETRLNVVIRQPTEIYPGQKVDVAIRVTDQFNKGVKDVNLTAYSVNTQFENIPLPDVPYMGLTRGVYPLNTYQPMGYVPDINYSTILKKYHFKTLNLFQNEVYALLYGKGGKTKIEMPVRRKSPEFSAYVYQGHQLQNIVYIKVDNQLVFHQYHLQPPAFSFPLEKGLHTISIRTFDRLLVYENLKADDSTKYILAFNLDSLQYRADTNLYLPGKLKPYEKNEFLDHTLFLSIKTSYDTFSILQKRHLKIFTANQTYPASLPFFRMENDRYLSIGPVEQDELRLKVNRQFEHDFVFERGKAYLAFADEIKELPIRDDLRQYGFISNVITHADIYNLNSFHALGYSPEYDTIPVQELEDEQEETVKPERERPHVEQKEYAPENLNYFQKGRIMFISQNYDLFNNAWLINKADHTMSVINSFQRSEQYYYREGEYDLLLFNDSSFCIYHNLRLKTNGTFVLFVKPSDFSPIDFEEIYPYESIVSELTREPFRSFTDTPIVIEPVKIIKKIYKTGMAKLSGVVMDGRFQTPIDYTNIFMEIDGYFKAGASSNSEGRFEINDLPPGNYMLKIRAADYRYQVIYNLKLEKGKELVIRLNLLHREDEVEYDDFGRVVIRPDKDGSKREMLYDHADYDAAPQQNSEMRYSRNSSNVSSSMSGISGRGSRNGDGTVVYVDGIRVNNSSLSQAENEQVYVSKEFAGLEANVMGDRLEALAQISQANRIRDKFRDYGYWIPNLLTDANGMAYFTVTFPDNITSWQTMVPAMNGKRQSGLSTMITRSFKPLSAQMAVPFFVTEGDRIILKGKTMNYTGTGQNIRIRFLVNDSLVKGRDAYVEQFLVDSLMFLIPKGADSVKSTFVFDMKNGYTDGEERHMPVRPNGIMVSRSMNIILKKDTTLRIGIPPDVKSARILVHNSEVERLMEEIEVLKNYSYGCVEQTTSKLRALLAEKALRNSLGLPFTGDKLVRKMIHLLNKQKNDFGTWTWWGGYGEEDWLTAYVMRTLNQARLAGYSNNVYIQAAKRLEKRLPYMSVGDRLFALNTLIDMDRDLKYDSFTKYIKKEDLDVNQKILFVRLLQKTGKKYQVSDITQHLRYSADGGIYFGENNMHYQNDLSSTSLVAYDILSHNDTGKEYLPYIRDFFYSSGYPRHTFALAEMISMGSEEVKKRKNTGIKITGEITVNGYTLKAADYPFKNNLKPGDTVTVSHKGPAAYATIVTSKLETNPQPDNTYFSILSSFGNQSGQINLSPGVPVELKINVSVFKNSEHVMVEVPLPAGFSYYGKPKASGVETYREYYYDKTSIFCKNLSAGNYIFSIMVVPKFSGTFNLPPAKIELMYYPEIHNNESVKVVTVE